ncbi:hypothetical protein C5167_023980 [Papaver somniferum]|uniref:Uncharacterized protein n=1 Tax=Papaver somniferum TaxID=3469 RepID=A0A4Y7JQL6_PAPSO|nr:hypothetical protein C5167_023980 [Papaver somniferum]
MKKINLISCEPMAHISDIKLIRTDTTLDLSQKAEKGSKLQSQNDEGLKLTPFEALYGYKPPQFSVSSTNAGINLGADEYLQQRLIMGQMLKGVLEED